MTTRNSAGSKRTRMSPQARREQFLDLGMEMLRTVDIEDVTTDAIADAAGVSRALLFHYFESKDDFHVAIAAAQADEMLARTAPDPSLGDPLEVLQAAMSEFVDYVHENGRAYRAILRGVTSTNPAMREVFDRTRSQMAGRVLDYAGALDVTVTPTVTMAVNGWISFVEEVTLAWLAGESGVQREELLALITGSLPSLALAATMAAQPS